MKQMLAASGLAVILAACGTTSSSGTPVSSGTQATRAPVNVLATPTRIAHTAAGTVGYREVGAGSPLLLITGFSASMDDWPPSFVDTLAGHHQVIVFDNAGVGQTAAAASSSITAMADQTSDLLSALHLHRSAVLGWSMGGMIAQALAVEHSGPGEPPRACAGTQAGTGTALPVPAKAAAQLASPNPATVLAALFPPQRRKRGQRLRHGDPPVPELLRGNGDHEGKPEPRHPAMADGTGSRRKAGWEAAGSDSGRRRHSGSAEPDG